MSDYPILVSRSRRGLWWEVPSLGPCNNLVLVSHSWWFLGSCVHLFWGDFLLRPCSSYLSSNILELFWVNFLWDLCDNIPCNIRPINSWIWLDVLMFFVFVGRSLILHDSLGMETWDSKIYFLLRYFIYVSSFIWIHCVSWEINSLEVLVFLWVICVGPPIVSVVPLS